MKGNPKNIKLFSRIANVLKSAKNQALHEVNRTMVRSYYEIGRMIVDEEQQGKNRADYGKQLIEELSSKLTSEFGRGFSKRNIEQMRQFYLTYRIPQTVSAEFKSAEKQKEAQSSKNEEAETIITKSYPEILEADEPLINEPETHKFYNRFKLSWSHYLKLMRIDDQNERSFYEIEAFKNSWSVRELQRQYDSALFTRLALSRDKDEVKRLSETGLILEKPQDAIKDPYILEFLDLPEHTTYSESDLEQALINKLENFLLELGSGFTFVARQKRISFEDKHFYIDLVFYNRILKSFVLIDLKIGELKHQDLGQMQMYVNFYDREVRLEDENKTVGMILCQNKSESVIRYTLPENNERIFASKYKTVLPGKEELKNLLQEPAAQYYKIQKTT